MIILLYVPNPNRLFAYMTFRIHGIIISIAYLLMLIQAIKRIKNVMQVIIFKKYFINRNGVLMNSDSYYYRDIAIERRFFIYILSKAVSMQMISTGSWAIFNSEHSLFKLSTLFDDNQEFSLKNNSPNSIVNIHLTLSP